MMMVVAMVSAHTEQAGGKTLEMRAEVGLLTRNVKVIGDDYSLMTQEAFGARIVVGRTSEGDGHVGRYTVHLLHHMINS